MAAGHRLRPALMALCATTVVAAVVWAAVPPGDGADVAGPRATPTAEVGSAEVPEQAGSRLPGAAQAREAVRRHRSAWRGWTDRLAARRAHARQAAPPLATPSTPPTASLTVPGTPSSTVPVTPSPSAPGALSPTPRATPRATAQASAPPTATPPTATPLPSRAASGAAAGAVPGGAAPVGDLPGWRQVFVDDFTTDAPLGRFGAVYGSHWTGYEGGSDTSRAGRYSEARTVSVADGVLDIHLRTEGGTPLVAAPVPLVGGRWGGQLHGRYAVRFRADPVPGYKTAWLLWPDSDVWADGEIDFPEGPLDGTVSGFVHCPGQPSRNCLAVDTRTGYSGWHTATVEWTATGVVFGLDGREVGRTGTSPSVPMHWVLQTETDGGRPPAAAAGHVQVDWVAVWAPA